MSSYKYNECNITEHSVERCARTPVEDFRQADTIDANDLYKSRDNKYRKIIWKL
jgi:hypothetical protein